jgi:hypothetical protein
VSLACYTYGTFAWHYWPGRDVDPGLYGYAPNVLLATLLGCGVATLADGRIADQRQLCRLAWYPGVATLACLPLWVGVTLRGDPVGASPTYPLVLGGAVGVGQEIRRW